MSYTVVVKEEAVAEALSAFTYYEEIQTGLGDRFLSALREHLEIIGRSPQHYSILKNFNLQVFRDIKIRKFPFVIIFEISGNDVIVYAVHNTYKQLPDKFA